MFDKYTVDGKSLVSLTDVLSFTYKDILKGYNVCIYCTYTYDASTLINRKPYTTFLLLKL